MTNYKHIVYYYGPENKKNVKELINKYHKLPGQINDIPEAKKFKQVQLENNMVYLVDYDIKQVHLLMVANAEAFNENDIPFSRIFNHYFGAGMSSIVFQEIRDSKGLAYSAYSVYSTPTKADRRNILYASMSTQADKLPEALSTMNNLLKTMPKAEKSFKEAKNSIVNKINSERLNPRTLVFEQLKSNDLNIETDIRKDIYETAQTMTMDELEKQFSKHIKGRKFAFLIIGKMKNIDLNKLKKLGEIKQLSLEELFGY